MGTYLQCDKNTVKFTVTVSLFKWLSFFSTWRREALYLDGFMVNGLSHIVACFSREIKLIK